MRTHSWSIWRSSVRQLFDIPIIDRQKMFIGSGYLNADWRCIPAQAGMINDVGQKSWREKPEPRLQPWRADQRCGGWAGCDCHRIAGPTVLCLRQHAAVAAGISHRWLSGAEAPDGAGISQSLHSLPMTTASLFNGQGYRCHFDEPFGRREIS